MALGDPASRPDFMLLMHGGAGTRHQPRLTIDEARACIALFDSTLRRGYDILDRGGTSLDAVQATIRLLEDSPLLNAGRGAVMTSAGTVELDAAIMDGSCLKAGAVAGLKQVKNPISLARLVMEQTSYVLLAGEGAEGLAREHGVELMPQEYFITERRRRALQRAKEAHRPPPDEKYGTVGAVALDRQGHLAAGTSTGGLTNKRPGRIGDSPIIGAGTYANETCAVSATGTGEYFIRNLVAYDICARMMYKGESLSQAAEEVVLCKLAAQDGEGGVIALDRDGNIAMPFNTETMLRGWIGPSGRTVVKMHR